MGNGYELIRQLTKEYSLRSRAECLSLCMQLVGKTFTSHATDSPVADVIRQIEYSIARYIRLMSTVQCVEDMSGLRIEDGDTLNILVRSLPTEVRNYALMHSSGATYSSFKEAARRFENQTSVVQRL